MNNADIANYTNEQTLFADLVSGNGDARILLFQGESGSGKSHLINHCLKSMPNIPSLLLKLQGEGDSVSTLFSSLGSRQGWDKLSLFTNTVAALLEQPGKATDPVWQLTCSRRAALSFLWKSSSPVGCQPASCAATVASMG